MTKSRGIALLAACLAVLTVFGAPLARQPQSPLTHSTEERAWLDENRHSIILAYDVAFPPIAGLCRRFIVHTGSVDFTLPRALSDLGLAQEDVFYKPVNAEDVVARIRESLKMV